MYQYTRYLPFYYSEENKIFKYDTDKFIFKLNPIMKTFLITLLAGVGVLSDNSVKLSVYYESLCPDSIRFITTQLFPTWQHFGNDILNVDLHPFGKANVGLQSDFTIFYSFTVL